jgi:hypothetical protein
MRKFVFLLITLILVNQSSKCQNSIDQTFITTEKGKDRFSISGGKNISPILISSKDWPGVIRAAKDLQSDIGKVTTLIPELLYDNISESKEIIIAGTIGKSTIIDKLISEGKIDVTNVKGKWESFVIEVINKPLPGIKSALIIAGSDKRGTIFGIYELSKQIGVSPWYWWADVPVLEKKELYVTRGRYVQGSPSVKYRGIFLNDEAPDLTNWIREKYGDVPESTNPPMPAGVANYGRDFYTRLFELILRLKGNYLWPPKWTKADRRTGSPRPVHRSTKRYRDLARGRRRGCLPGGLWS